MKLPRGAKLLTPRQVAALASPLRFEILEHLVQAGRSSVADVAALMGRSATVLHYHLKLLHGAGLVRVAGRRQAGKRGEALFELVATTFAVAGKLQDKRSLGDVERTLGAMLRLAQREARRALHARDARDQPPRRTFHTRRLRAPLSDASLERVNKLLDELESVFTRAVKQHIGRGRTRAEPSGAVVSLTFVLTPAGRAGGKGGAP